MDVGSVAVQYPKPKHSILYIENILSTLMLRRSNPDGKQASNSQNGLSKLGFDHLISFNRLEEPTIKTRCRSVRLKHYVNQDYSRQILLSLLFAFLYDKSIT